MDVIMPQLGESIAEATVVRLLVQIGDQVTVDQDLIEVETNKATMTVASPCAGRIEKILATLNESYPVGAVLGYIEASKEEAERHKYQEQMETTKMQLDYQYSDENYYWGTWGSFYSRW